MHKLEEGLTAVKKRTADIEKTKLATIEDMDNLLHEIGEVADAYYGCQQETAQLHAMHAIIQKYKSCYIQLQESNLTWDEFDALAEKLQQEAVGMFDESSNPWPPGKVFKQFLDNLTKHRNKLSKEWVTEMEGEAALVDSMGAGEAESLHRKISGPPPYLTEQHKKRVKSIGAKVEDHLDALDFEWILERFKRLSESSKRKFLEAVKGMLA